MCRVASAGVRLPINRLDAHLLHQRADVFSADLNAFQLEHVA